MNSNSFDEEMFFFDDDEAVSTDKKTKVVECNQCVCCAKTQYYVY